MSLGPLRIFSVLLASTWLVACAAQPEAPAAPAAIDMSPATSDAATLALIDAALAGDHRAAGHADRDQYRHPKETLAFFGLRQDMTVMEIWPGGSGWYTEILAPVLRDRGRYIAASWDPNFDSKYVQDNLKAYRAKLDARPDLYMNVTLTALQFPTALAPVAAGSVDLVLTFRNIHNWMPRDADAPMFAAMFAALKPGGTLGVVEHRALDNVPQDPKARSGYVREDHVIALAETAGFKLIGKSEVNANAKDGRDHDQGVWTLPPSFRLGDKDRERYAAIGESDRMTLRFEKPATP